MSPRPIGFGIIGTGGMAARMAATLRGLPRVSLLGVASGSGRAAGFAAAHGIPSAQDSLEGLLALPGLEAVYIGHANAGHAAAIRAAAAAGKAILCEKPFALNTAEGAAALAAVEAAGVLFMEALAPPFLPAYRRLAGQAAALEGPLHLEASFGAPEDPALRPGLFAPGAGALRDRGIYLLALARQLLGPVESLQAVLRRGEGGVDTHAALLLRHAGGHSAHLTASLEALLPNAVTLGARSGLLRLGGHVMLPESLYHRAAPPPSRQGAEAPGTGLKARLRRSPWLRRLRAALPQERAEALPWGEDPYQWEAAHFCDLLRQGARRSPVLPPEFSREVLGLIEEAEKNSVLF
ncbi:Gfo/Idh/MocA family oxidoreductase [Roseomonas sp. GC11]|uniref:Gfo/Idh/MocA family oxidoreductase n=1 Tax=Roseomonas sp. GC11 TaxID=2950546 RepID=UPI00210E4963|nr:Gfo/Idh/MocA family oxidoreductase [Roseomonas sp. GC11]MCQ4162325.1 Gfo/Idh/MocA family oxidoreductase [Roseomonas sp. GC11]